MSDRSVMSPDAQTIFSAPKILHHPDRLLPYVAARHESVTAGSLSGTTASVPVTMEIDLTNVCSHRCPLCVGHRVANAHAEQLFSVAGNGEQIPTRRAAGYIGQMAAAGVRGLIFTGGGEPTVHRDLEELVALARSLGMDVGLITHGGLLHRRDVASLVADCTWIRVSVDAATVEEYAAVHGCGRAEWDRVWCNIALLSSTAKEIEGDGRCPATIGVGYLAGPANGHQLLLFAERCRDHGVDYAQVRPFHRYATLDMTDRIREAQQRFGTSRFQVVGSLQKYSQIADGRIAARTYEFCHVTQFASVVCANERMYVCCHHRNMEAFCIGDLRTQTFMEIVSSPRRATVNASIKVEACQPLCRGDHVNRCVEQAITAGATAPLTFVPRHVNFL
jgi:cyclic pyranopterin phosphate synthase